MTKYMLRRRTDCAGFTVVELLVVIAITWILICMLLPAVQKSRETLARQGAEGVVRIIQADAKAFRGARGEDPDSLVSLEEFCEANPPLCAGGALRYGILTAGMGLDATVSRGSRGLVIEAAPRYPGIHGSSTCQISESGVITCFATPGAARAREEAFARIVVAAASTVEELLARRGEAPSIVRAYLEGPGVGNDVQRFADRNGNGMLDLGDMYDFPGAVAHRLDGLDEAAGEPLQRFLQLVAWELKLELLPEANQPGIGLKNLTPFLGAAFFTPDTVCMLTRTHVTDARVAGRLCALLRGGGGTPGIEPRQEEFLEMLDAEINRTITRKNAATIAAFQRLSAGHDQPAGR